jgi:hypothetical protein
MGVTISITSKPLVSTDIASPCGFLAKNFPTDDYKTMRKIDTGTFYQIVVSDLTPREEVDKYSIKNIDSSWIRVNQTRFINWMVSGR